MNGRVKQLRGVMQKVFLFLIATSLLSCVALAAGSMAQHPLICVYYYVWYGGPDHLWTNVTDVPALGYYNSSHLNVIIRQLDWIREAEINCLIISWWGPGHFTDRVAQRVFELLPKYGLRAAILIEPYQGGDPSLYNASWWNQTLAYIKENYIDKYPKSYLYLNGRPLILAFNPIGMKYSPSADFHDYAIRIVGNDIDNAKYQDWDLWPDYDKGLTGKLRLRRDGYVALAPRFDDEHFRPGGAPPYDPDLSRGWYVKQWEWVLRHRDQVRIIAIYSWNEFHERSAIEPHNDATHKGDPYYLYKLTQEYIKKLKQSEWFLSSVRSCILLVTSIFLLSLAVIFLTKVIRS